MSLLLASSLTVLSSTLLSPALPAIESTFHATPNVATLSRLVLTLPAALIVVSAPIAGTLVDRLGRRSVLCGAIVVYAAGGTAGYLGTELWHLLVVRAIQGVGVGALTVATTTLIADYFSGDRRDTVLGWQGATFNITGFLSLAGGGSLAALGWRVPFLVYGAAIVLVPLVFVIIDEPETTSSSDALSFDLLESTPVGLLSGVYLLTYLCATVFYLLTVQLPFYLQGAGAMTATGSGLLIGSYNLVAMVVALRVSWIKRRVGPTGLFVSVFGLMGTGYLIIGESSSIAVILTGLVVAGLGWGLMLPTANLWIARLAPERIRGRAMSGVTMTLYLGQFSTPLVSQPLIERLGYATTFSLAGGLGVLVGAVVVLWGRRLSQGTVETLATDTV